jgi:hypothetical protein
MLHCGCGHDDVATLIDDFSYRLYQQQQLYSIFECDQLPAAALAAAVHHIHD